MLHWRVYGSIGLAIFWGDVSMEELTSFSEKVVDVVQGKTEFFVVAVPLDGAKFPTRIQEMSKAAGKIKDVSKIVTRYYGVRTSIILSFIASTLSSLFSIKGNMVEATNLLDLYARLLRDSELFPGLRASISHLDAIKADIESHKLGAKVS